MINTIQGNYTPIIAGNTASTPLNNEVPTEINTDTRFAVNTTGTPAVRTVMADVKPVDELIRSDKIDLKTQELAKDKNKQPEYNLNSALIPIQNQDIQNTITPLTTPPISKEELVVIGAATAVPQSAQFATALLTNFNQADVNNNGLISGAEETSYADRWFYSLFTMR